MTVGQSVTASPPCHFKNTLQTVEEPGIELHRGYFQICDLNNCIYRTLGKECLFEGKKKDKIKKKKGRTFFLKRGKKGFQTDYYRNCGLKQSNSSFTFQSACVAREQMRIFIEDCTKGKRRKGKEKNCSQQPVKATGPKTTPPNVEVWGAGFSN